MSPVFPPEIFETIIDFLHGDVPSLATCGLVCTEWNAASRFHLFSTLELASFDLDRALEVICTKGSTIPQHVRTLDITNAGQLDIDNLPPLPSIRTLVLSQVEGNTLTPRTKKRLSEILQNVTVLSLAHITFESLNQAFDFISSARHLKVLDLQSIYCSQYDKPDVQVNVAELNQLSVDAGDFSIYLFNQLCSQGNPPAVRRLEVNYIIPRVVSSTCKLLIFLGYSLENLHLSSSSFGAPGETAEDILSKEIDLSQNSSLSSISFSSIILYKDTPGRITPHWIFKILSQKISNPLQSVSLTIYARSPDEIDILDLPYLGGLFSDRSSLLYKESTKLSFTILGVLPPQRLPVAAAIRKELPALDSEGRLLFQI